MKVAILFRYLLKLQLIAFVVTSILVAVVVFSINLFDTIRTLSSHNLPVTKGAFECSAYKMIEIMCSLIPYTFLISNTFMMKKLNQTDQMTILKNLGYSIYDIVAPSIWLGLAIGLLNMLVWHPLAVISATHSRILHYQLINKPVPIESKELWIQQKSGEQDRLIYIDEVDANTLKSVVIYYFSDPKCRQIVAESATIGPKNNWTLKNGAVVFADKHMEKFSEKLIPNALKEKHIAMYYRDPINSDIFTLFSIISLRHEMDMPVRKYMFQLNLLLTKIFLPPLMAMLAMLFCYTHHRYAYKTLSLLATVISGFIAHFLSQAVQSIGVSHKSSPVMSWGMILTLYIIVVICMNDKES